MGCVNNKKEANQCERGAVAPAGNNPQNRSIPKIKRSRHRQMRTDTSIEQGLRRREQEKLASDRKQGHEEIEQNDNAGGSVDEEKRRSKILQNYQLDIEESPERPAKIQTFNYEKLLVHNPIPAND